MSDDFVELAPPGRKAAAPKGVVRVKIARIRGGAPRVTISVDRSVFPGRRAVIAWSSATRTFRLTADERGSFDGMTLGPGGKGNRIAFRLDVPEGLDRADASHVAGHRVDGRSLFVVLPPPRWRRRRVGNLDGAGSAACCRRCQSGYARDLRASSRHRSSQSGRPCAQLLRA